MRRPESNQLFADEAFVTSAPSPQLLAATLLVVVAASVIPFTPLGQAMGFTHVSLIFFPALGAILVCFAFSTEIAKLLFYRAHP